MLRRALRAQAARALKPGKTLVNTTAAASVAPQQQQQVPCTQVRFQSTEAITNVDRAQLEGGLRGVVGTIALVETDAVYVEAWLPDDSGNLRCGDAWQAADAEGFAEVRKAHEQTRIVSSGILMDAVNSHHAMYKASNLSAEDFPGIANQLDDFSIAALPILSEGKTVVVLGLLYKQGTLPPQQQLERMRGDLTIAVSHIIAGADVSFDGVQQDNEEIFDAQRQKVIEILVADGLFSEKAANEETNAFYTLGISPLYFAQHNPVQIAKHLTSYIGAKTAALTTLADMDPTQLGAAADLSDMTFQFIGKREAVFFCLDDKQEMESMIHRMNQYVDATEEGLTTSVTLFKSRQHLLHGRALVLCTVTRSRFLKKDVNRDDVPDIWSISSAQFLRSKSRSGRNRYDKLLKEAHGKLHPMAVVRPRAPGHVMMLVFPNEAPTDGMLQLFRVLDYLGLNCSQLFAETFANGMVTYNVYLEQTDKSLSEEKLQRNLISLTRRMTTLAVLPKAALHLSTPALGPRAKLYFGCAQMFTYYFIPNRSEDFIALRSYLADGKQDVCVDRLDRIGRIMHKNAVNIERFNRTIELYPSLSWAVYEDFLTPRKPGTAASEVTVNETLMARIKKEVVDPVDSGILQCCLLFNASVLKTNFFDREKAATSFRLKPSLFISTEYPEVPHAIFMVVGSTFQGFHIRFRDISRGGIRMIKSPNKSYHKNLQSQFEETYNLAFTQQLKNKDIPEGGSKGTILLNSDPKCQTARSADDAFKAYIDSLLDLILQNDQVVDLLGEKEILFFGPDEGTAGDVVVWAAEHAHKRGYPYWKAITTGKPSTMGGIPHDVYGMTTRSVHQQVLGVLRCQNRNEEEVTKVQTGGPDGDLGSNEILISKDKTIAVVDGSGVLYDPEGLDRDELRRLVKARHMVDKFNTDKLHAGGYLVLIGEKDRALPNGEVVDGLTFRNEYHLRKDLVADLFLPCGGRPESVNINNVHHMLHKDGTPRFKYIIEGANLFITRDARRVLEDHGVILMKDATCNKGGVTSSSLEVLAALAMSDEQHNELMCVKPDGTVPEFYKQYVEAVQAVIEENARLEFEACWRERELGRHKYMIEITDLLSKKINSINDTLQQSAFMRENDHMKRLILQKALPELLLKQVSMDLVLERVPDAYLLAICGAYFAAHYVYRYGLDASEACIIDFMQDFVKIAP